MEVFSQCFKCKYFICTLILCHKMYHKALKICSYYHYILISISLCTFEDYFMDYQHSELSLATILGSETVISVYARIINRLFINAIR